MGELQTSRESERACVRESGEGTHARHGRNSAVCSSACAPEHVPSAVSRVERYPCLLCSSRSSTRPSGAPTGGRGGRPWIGRAVVLQVRAWLVARARNGRSLCLSFMHPPLTRGMRSGGAWTGH